MEVETNYTEIVADITWLKRKGVQLDKTNNKASSDVGTLHMPSRQHSFKQYILQFWNENIAM
jgi:hypothetical protein